MRVLTGVTIICHSLADVVHLFFGGGGGLRGALLRVIDDWWGPKLWQPIYIKGQGTRLRQA